MPILISVLFCGLQEEKKTDENSGCCLFSVGARRCSSFVKKSCSFGLPCVSFVNACQFVHVCVLLFRMGWMICDFTSFSTGFQSYQDDGRLILKSCVQWSSVYGFRVGFGI